MLRGMVFEGVAERECGEYRRGRVPMWAVTGVLDDVFYHVTFHLITEN